MTYLLTCYDRVPAVGWQAGRCVGY